MFLYKICEIKMSLINKSLKIILISFVRFIYKQAKYDFLVKNFNFDLIVRLYVNIDLKHM